METRKEVQARKRREAKEKEKREKEAKRLKKQKASYESEDSGHYPSQETIYPESSGKDKKARHEKFDRHLTYANIILFLALIILALYTLFI